MNDWGRIAVMVVIIAAVIGIVLVALNVFGVAIPSWAVTIFWIIVAAAVAIGAIKLLIRWMP
jgi:uncharacterized membrane protein YbaN (DUF454 family)